MTNQKLKDAQKMLQSPCTITEAVQIAQGVVEDAMATYQNKTRSLQVSISLQLEILKEVVIKAGLISEEDFRKKYMEQVDIINAQMKNQAAQSVEDSNPKMGVSVSEVEIKEEK